MQNKSLRSYFYYFLIAAIAVIAAVYFFSNDKGTFKLRNISFAIEDLNEIDQIVLKTSTKKIELNQINGIWKVNGKYLVKERAIQNFLMALNRIELKSPVSKIERSQVASILKSDGILVEINKNNKSISSYYVSKPSMNKSKTYMMMENTDKPFHVHIPAFKGSVAELYVIEENFWRDHTVFNYQPQHIKEIKLEYAQKEKSFSLTNYNDGTFSVKSLKDNSYLENFNVEHVANYFTYFQGVEFEKVLDDLKLVQVDSILSSEPYLKIAVTDFNKDENSICIYRKPPEKELDEFGHKANFDYNKAYATLNDSREIILIQYYIFDPLLKEINYFR